ncbi:MAG: hypothetical protein K8H74_06470 [Notoacmeibacter sp.]|nr:hypothetical protein [Notoacmeibacter sp.]
MMRKLTSLAVLAAAATLLLAAAPVDNAGAGGDRRAVTVAALAPGDASPVQTCRDGSVSATGCRDEGVKVAAGNECPAASGKYCSDEKPYCCGTPGNYYCAIDVNHC